MIVKVGRFQKVSYIGAVIFPPNEPIIVRKFDPDLLQVKLYFKYTRLFIIVKFLLN